MQTSRLTFASLAVEWLRFEPRIGVLTEIGRGSAARDPLNDPVVQAFSEFLIQRYRRHTLDDLDHLLTDFLQRYQDLPAWWQAAIRENRIEFVFEEGEPRVKRDDLGVWRQLCLQLDPDTLIARALAGKHGGTPPPEHLRGWGVVIGGDSHAVRRLFHDFRLYDTHTHLEGCECMPLMWLRIVAGELRPGDFEEYRVACRPGVAERTPERAQLFAEMRRIGDAIDAFRQLHREHWPSGSPWDAASLSLFPSRVAAELWPERATLIESWVKLLALDGDGRRLRFDASLAAAFDRYTQGKSTFLTRFIQGEGANPGLIAFRRYFDRGKILPRKPSRRLVRDRMSRMIGYATESPGLAGIEFRIAPLASRAEYVRFFEDVAKCLERLNPRSPGLDVSFIVHFIRYRPSKARLKAINAPHRDDPAYALELHPAHIQEDTVRMQVDRQSAILHRFRAQRPDLAEYIVGIDVANVERLNPVHLFSPYLRLLRNSEWPHEKDIVPAQFRHWTDLKQRGLVTPGPNVPMLGLTFHAGEDYFHPLDGIKSIWEYYTFCGTREGDRIGHGLALGADIQAFNEDAGRSAILPRGAALDLVTWLRRRLSALPLVDPRFIRQLDDDVAKLSADVYGKVHPADDLYALLKLRHLVSAQQPEETRDQRAREILKEERDSQDSSEKRRQYVPLPDSVIDLEQRNHEAFEMLRDQIVQEVIDKGLYVECNPSSNIAVSGISGIAEHPIIQLFQRKQDLKFTISCDDPGTFGTRLEVEYGLLRDALRSRKVNAGPLEDVLERVARASERSAFSTPPNRKSQPRASHV